MAYDDTNLVSYSAGGHKNWFFESKIGFAGVKSTCRQKCIPSGDSGAACVPMSFPAS